ncbi:MAG: acyltransferase [Chthoniobacter sp.]
MRWELGRVYVFFVLSGYWVCRMWREKYRPRSHPLAAFLASRFWRLWPTYFVCQWIGLAVLMRFSPRWAAEAALMANPLWILRALAIVSAGSQFNPVAPIWTLDIEMQFYLLLPFLAWALARVFGLPSAARMAVLALALAGLGAIFYREGLGNAGFRVLPPYLIFFSLGMITFYSGWQPARWMGLGAAALVVAILGVVACHPTWRNLMGPAATRTALVNLQSGNVLLCGLLAVLFTPYAAFTVSQPSPAWDRHLGNISYVLYLFHYPVQMAMDWAGPSLSASPTVRGALQMAALVGGTCVLYRLVDLPSERWRHAVLEKRRALPAAENSIRP